MDITICEFCKSYVTNFEVHNCFNLGNKPHRSYASIPQHSSANFAQNSDSRAPQPMDYEARWSSADHLHSSMQQSVLHSIHQRTGYEENAAAEMFYRHGISNQNPYNPEISDFMFPGMHHIQENESNSTHLQLPSEVGEIFMPRNSQNYEPLIPEYPANIPMFVSERTILTGSQQTFGQRNAQMNQLSQHPKAFSPMECNGMSSTNKLLPNFSSAYQTFDESDHTLTNRVSQYSEKSLEMPILSIQNPNNPMIQTSGINSIQPTQQLSSFASLSCDFPLDRPSFYMDTRCSNKQESTLNRTETENPKYSAGHFSLPCISQKSVTSQEYHINNPGAVKIEKGKNYPKNKQLTDFSYAIAENISYTSNAKQIHQRNFGGEIKNNNIQSHTWEHLNFVTGPCENKNACTSCVGNLAREVGVNCKKNLEDESFGRKACTLKKKMDVPHKTKKTSYKCSKCPMRSRRKVYLDSHECCHNIEKTYVCSFCDKAFTQSGNLGVHIRTHTGEKPYSCTNCSKSFAKSSDLKRHIRSIHRHEKPYSCNQCGKCFADSGNLSRHVRRIHTGERP
ncbi:hypothetical protein CDAR_193231 [Caerostris darwini]|uniref:C2H2-type domain-containing protein n=1 Tax=Caerostris darwini TaxID=1538125 RepID=A0AAV4QX65_9ARAC|nr:hypothetical protein CDAR_193231 [Caerostris darwini]